MSKKKNIDIGGKFYSPIYYLNDKDELELFDVYKHFIREVIYSDPATIVIWEDGTKTVSKCKAPDSYNAEMGLLLCCMKKLVGTAALLDTFKDWVPLDEISKNNNHLKIKISDIRNKKKNA